MSTALLTHCSMVAGMTRLNYDLETNGLLSRGKDLKVHVAAVIDVDTGTELAFVNKDYKVPQADGTLEDFMDLVSGLGPEDELSAHNGIGFDNEVMRMVYDFDHSAQNYDTMIAGLIGYPDLKDRDFQQIKKSKRIGKPHMPGNLAGRSSLEAWGYRLGVEKGDYGKGRTDWDVFDIDMFNYCLQDVRVGVALRKHLESRHIPKNILDMEQKFAHIMMLQERRGFAFDMEKAEELLAELSIEQAGLTDKLQRLFPPRTVVSFTPKKKLRREKIVPFNPNSKQDIADRLKEKYGWEPLEFTDSGQAKMDDNVLSSLDYPEAKTLARSSMLNKRIAQISTGRAAWLKKVGEDGRLHGRVINIGTPHSRCAHSNPNMAQVPGAAKPFGLRCRSLFRASEGMVMVGTDAQGIQLRALAHYLAPYDDGAYVDIVTKGDPHEANRIAAGLDERFEAKVFIYSYLFGAGNAHIGGQLGKEGQAAVRFGKKVRTQFDTRTVGIAQLRAGLKVAAQRGHIFSIGGRYVPLRSDHVALNYLLTSFEVDVMKTATNYVHDHADEYDLEWGVDYANLAHVHDEFQFEVVPEKVENLKTLTCLSIQKAGELLGSRCPQNGEAKEGPTWAETH